MIGVGAVAALVRFVQVALPTVGTKHGTVLLTLHGRTSRRGHMFAEPSSVRFTPINCGGTIAHG